MSANNEVVGVIAYVASNYSKVIKRSILRKFIAGGIGLSCGGRDPRACIKEEMSNLQARAKRGSRIAQHQLGRIYDEGLEVQQDFSLALKWFHRSADQGDLSTVLGVEDVLEQMRRDSSSSCHKVFE